MYFATSSSTSFLVGEKNSRRSEAATRLSPNRLQRSLAPRSSSTHLKTPHERLLCEYSDVQPYVIHLVRDAPAFVKSFIKKDPRKLQTAIRWWNRSIWQMERLKRTVPAERWIFLRYEDLCAEPEAELRRVLKFLGVDADAPILDYRSAPHHIIGNRMRLRDSSKIRLDTSWREELSGTQLDEIIANTVENRQRFGYS